MSKHTQGPWRVYERRIPYSRDGIQGEHIERKICTEWHHPQSKGPQCVVGISTGLAGENYPDTVKFLGITEEDARLIAAAPDLFSEGEKLVNWLDRLADDCESKAKTTTFITMKDAYIADSKNYRASAKGMKAVIAKAKESGQ